jgi:hypothetical protein
MDQDANGDGQVAMAEYASFWSDGKAREFARYDLDRDGIITPRECLNADTAVLDTAVAAEGSEGGGVEGGAEGVASEPTAETKSEGQSAAWWMN